MLNKSRKGDVANAHKAALNRARVAASAARGEDVAVGGFEYTGELLTLLMRLRTPTGEPYLTEAEANSYAPDRAARHRFNKILRRAMTALVADIVAGKVRLMH